MRVALELAERGLLPDALVRLGIRDLLRRRLQAELGPSPDAQGEAFNRFLDELRSSPVALSTDDANRQHYEVPPELFEAMLGPALKYSCCLWPDGVDELELAEEAMLDLTARRAGLADGQRVLDLGCGWGSLSLWAARRYPGSRILAVSNSASQREHVVARAAREGLDNVKVVTADVNRFEPDGAFDRVVSVEMMEHCRNLEELFRRVASWIAPDGRLFVHVFCHSTLAYPFEAAGEDDWMAREFFTGGMMPSADLPLHFQRDLVLERRWLVGGLHYARTLEAWLERLDRSRHVALAALARQRGEPDARRWFQRWRIFLMACAELFAFNEGREWLVGHYLFSRRETELEVS